MKYHIVAKNMLFPQAMLQFALSIILCLTAQFMSSCCDADELVEPFKLIKVAEELKVEKNARFFQRRLQFHLEGNTLREFGYQFERETGLFCWIDVRINPEQEITFHSQFKSLGGILDDLCQQKNLKWLTCGKGVFLTDGSTAKLLPMLIAWQKEQSETHEINTQEKLSWLKGVPVYWPLLSRPAELCKKLVANTHLKLSGVEFVPHDLLAPGKNQEISPLEQMQTLLVQYGLTWVRQHQREITIIPINELKLISVSYDIDMNKREKHREFAKSLRDLKLVERSKTWVVTATPESLAEFHDYYLLNKVNIQKTDNEVVKLTNRKFTLKVENGSVLEMLEFLKNNQINITWDKNISNVSGVKLDTRVSFDLKDAGIEDLLTKVLSSTGLTYKLDEDQIKVFPEKTLLP